MGLFDAVIKPAQAGQQAYKIPASVTLAQWALESGYGHYMPPGSNNPFGIKAKAGQPFVTSKTHEVIHGVTKVMYQNFARFDTLTDAFEAHAELFFNGYYKVALTHLDNPKLFAMALTHVYATDPLYGTKLIGIMDHNNLYQYDLPFAKPTGAIA